LTTTEPVHGLTREVCVALFCWLGLVGPAAAITPSECPEQRPEGVINQPSRANDLVTSAEDPGRRKGIAGLLVVDALGASFAPGFVAAAVAAFAHDRPPDLQGLAFTNAVFPDGLSLAFAAVDVPLEVSAACVYGTLSAERASFGRYLALRDIRVD